jgi:alanine racemase
VHRVTPPATVGYGRTYAVATPECLALIPIGYADGYRRGLSNRGWMAIGTMRADIVGRVSMDQTVIRVPPGASVTPGDPVVVFGRADGIAPTADDLAGLLDTISYEIVSGIAARVPRHFVRDGQVIAVESLPVG